MGLKEAFKAAAQTAFTAASNVKKTVTYRSKSSTNPTYTPSSATVSDSYSEYSIQVICEDYNSREIDNQTVLSTDLKVLIPVDNVNFTPKINDTIVIDDIVWEIIGIHKDPADALYTFHSRKP